MYRRVSLSFALATVTAIAAIPVVHAAESDACRDIRVRYEAIKPQISAIEVSLTLFSAADKNCIDVATRLLDSGASVDASDYVLGRREGHRP